MTAFCLSECGMPIVNKQMVDSSQREVTTMFKDWSKKFLISAALLMGFFLGTGSAVQSNAQMRLPDLGRLGDAVNVQLKVGEITLDSIDFRNQTAQLTVGFDVANGIIPISLKDFDYRLRLADRDVIEGSHTGTLKIGGRRASRVNLPVTVNLRSIPSVVWSAFTNRGRVRYDLDSAFTLPLFVTEKRLDQSFSGEVPLRSLVDAASILRARRVGDGGSGAARIWDRLPW
jgi:LEA14-like dessication related protein